MVRGIRPFVEGRRIAALRKSRCKCKDISITPPLPQLRRRIVGETVTEVRRLAKRVVLDLSTGDSLVIEPRMTGLMLLADPPDREHLRLQWEFAGTREFNSLIFWDRRGLGTVRLFRPDEFEQYFGNGRLGPDALAISLKEWSKRFSSTRRAIKVALLDQKLTAGIGNLYASEILHAARIHPATPAGSLSAEQLRRLWRATRRILKSAIRYEGSTLGDATYRNALNRAGRYQSQHRVYNRAGKMCGVCNAAAIERIVQAQRSTFFCPCCQPEAYR